MEKKLAKLILEAVDEWKTTGKLPSGESWYPGQENFEKLKERHCGVDLSKFYSEFCPRFNICRELARDMLLYLEMKGKIRIVWHSPKGARFFPLD